MTNGTEWRIRKEASYDRETHRWSRHKAWSLYFRGKRVARYLRWRLCIEHIQTYCDKFGSERNTNATEA